MSGPAELAAAVQAALDMPASTWEDRDAHYDLLRQRAAYMAGVLDALARGDEAMLESTIEVLRGVPGCFPVTYRVSGPAAAGGVS